MAETRPKPVDPERPPKEDEPDSGVRELVLQTEILDELRRMNRLLNNITRGSRRYTLAFFSGIVRGLGAAIGATVVFALLVGILSRVNTIPLIGSYLAKVVEVAAQSSPTIGRVSDPEPTPAESPVAAESPAATPATSPVPAESSAPTPAATPAQ